MYSTRVLCIVVILMIMLPVAVVAQLFSDAQAFSITRSSGQTMNLRFQLPEWEIEEVMVDGEKHQRVKIEDTPYLFIDEKETLPVFTTVIAIPYSGGFTVNTFNSANEVRSFSSAEFDVQLFAERNSGRHQGNMYPSQNILVSEPKVIRDFRVISINVQPFQYDQDNRTLLVNNEIDIQISFNDLPSINEISPPQKISRSFEKIYRSLILNYEDMISRTAEYQNPGMIVVYGNYSDTTYLAKVNEYVAWKKQKGYTVTAVSTATTGNSYTGIKSYLQNAYDTWQIKPEYVVLIGDIGTTIQIPTNNSYADYEYTWLAGNDNLGDVMIGRISVSNTDEMVKYIKKVMTVDRDIDTSAAAWLNKMVLVGDSSSSGISTIYTNRYIRNISEVVNPAYTYTELYGSSPSSTSINAAINQGVSFYNYRGYLGMSGWPSTMNNMFNGSKLFHAVFITCDTGSFHNGTSTTESVIRYGTEASLGGAVTAIGMATTSTHTTLNNCLDVGIFHGLYPGEMREMSSAMLLGKLYLDAVYGVVNPTQALSFARFCNLIGDPTASVYVGIPTTFNIDAPSSIVAGTPNIEVVARDNNNQLVEGAGVVLTDASGMQITGWTDVYGIAVLDIPTSQSLPMTLTISKEDHKPEVSTITIDGSGGIVYDSYIADDDTATGNGDGLLDAGEQVNLYVTIRNTSASTVFLSGSATCSDPYITMLDANRIEFNSIAPGAYGENENPIAFNIAPNCPNNHQFVIRLAIEGSHNEILIIPLVVRNGYLEIQSYNFIGTTENIVNPGAILPLTFSLRNLGLNNLTGVNGILRSFDNYLQIQDSLGVFGTIAVNNTVTNSANTFEVYARGTCVVGMVIPLELHLYNSSGFSQTISLSITIGQTSVNDPLGQDAYGYFIFDQGDTAYIQCPTYNWIPIAPAEGGSGTLLALTDPGVTGDEGDQVGAVSITTVNLPFTFNFYGRSYTQASISSNGFISMGATQNSDWRNWRLPGPGGPNPMIAVFWDDLQLAADCGVYTYYNSAQHYYVVEWYNVISGYDRVTRETFQAILYDPIFYPTATNDGQIKMQYKVFNNIDTGSGTVDGIPHGKFATIGIKDHNGTVGLEYTFNNTYPTAAAPLNNQKALFVTTRGILSENPHLTIQQTVINDANGNGYLEPAENSNLNIMLRNSGLVAANNVSAVLSTTSPYVQVTSATANYGNIASEAIGTPLTPHAISVLSNCPAGYNIPFTLTITSSTNSWTYNFTLTVHTPILSFGDVTVIDSTGDQDGNLDPGETAVLSIPLHNSGLVASSAGTATISSSTPGLNIVSGTANFSPVAGEGYATLNFTVNVSAGVSIGTLATVQFNATAGSYTASASKQLEIGAPTEIIVGTGTQVQSYPLDRYYNYSAHEAIYLASEIGQGGTIKSIAFYKGSGTDTSPIEAVTVYMKHTTATTIATGDYSLTGYTQVYNGSFTNDAASGWMEINLDTMFSYSGTQNLSILCIKGYQQWIQGYPQWRYTATAGTRARQNRSDDNAPTNLSASSSLPNIRFKVFPAAGVLYPPQNLAATPGFNSVSLEWDAPVSGIPISYKVYRNTALLASATGLSYTDNTAINGTSYSYYVKALYSGGESAASNTVNATPYAATPQNLTASASNNMVSLLWEAPVSGSPTTYKIYRNSTYLASETGLAFFDVDVINQTTYSYYITALYNTEESGSSNTVQATPTHTASIQANLGTGTSVSYGNTISPVNISYRSVHSQFVYTAAELNEAGIYGPINIVQLGFDVVTTPAHPLPNYLIRMKHTTATNAASWHTAQNLETVYSAASYQPAAGGWDMLVFNTPFTWNGVDNILFDTAFSLTTAWTNSGTLRYTAMQSGQRFARSDSADQTNVFSGNYTNTCRPNIRIAAGSNTTGANIVLGSSQLSFGSVMIGETSTLPFTVQNTGDELMAGYFTLPTGYSISQSRSGRTSELFTTNPEQNRDGLRFTLPAGQSQTFYLSFSPVNVQSYNGTVSVTTNAVNVSPANISVQGSGASPNLQAPNVNISYNGNTARLAWSAIPNAQGYKIYRSESPSGPFTLVGTTTQLNFSDNWLQKAFYYVKATSEIPTREP